MVISSAEEPTVLGAAPVQAMLTAPEGEGKGGQSSLAANLLSLPSGVTAYLVLQGLSADVPPGITYNVYLGLPTEAPTAGPADPHYVGSLSFFDAVGRPQSVAEGSAAAAFDVTNLVVGLAQAGDIGESLAVRIDPAGKPSSAASPVIARIALVAR